MRYMSVLWWAFSSVAICVSSKYLLVEVDSNQLEEHKLKETLESGPERELVSNKSIGDCELIPEMIKNIPRIQMRSMIYLNRYIQCIPTTAFEVAKRTLD